MSTTIHDSLTARAKARAMNNATDPDPEVPERPRGPRRYSAKYKARILEEYEHLDKAGKGALLRRERLSTSLISNWRKQRDGGALEALAKQWGHAPAHLAVQWLLSRPALAAAIIGPETPEELKHNVGAFDVRLDATQMIALDEIGQGVPSIGF